jgi:SpoVK/Ycf46/Vps4 family AAA+-type ATPase
VVSPILEIFKLGASSVVLAIAALVHSFIRRRNYILFILFCVHSLGAEIENLCRESAIQSCRELMEEIERKVESSSDTTRPTWAQDEAYAPQVFQRHFESAISEIQKSKIESVGPGFNSVRIKHL